MEEEKRQFLLAEYATVRAEVLDTLKEVPSNEKLALVLSGAFWAWLVASAGTSPYLFLAVWIPLALTCVFRLRANSLDKKFDAFHAYILKLETEFKLEGLGWETFLEEEGKNWFARSTKWFWAVLIGGNLVFAVVTTVIYALWACDYAI